MAARLLDSLDASKFGSHFRAFRVVAARGDEELRCADIGRERERDFISKAFPGRLRGNGFDQEIVCGQDKEGTVVSARHK